MLGPAGPALRRYTRSKTVQLVFGVCGERSAGTAGPGCTSNQKQMGNSNVQEDARRSSGAGAVVLGTAAMVDAASPNDATLGLAGLAGLAGLKRREPDTRYVDIATTPR